MSRREKWKKGRALRLRWHTTGSLGTSRVSLRATCVHARVPRPSQPGRWDKGNITYALFGLPKCLGSSYSILWTKILYSVGDSRVSMLPHIAANARCRWVVLRTTMRLRLNAASHTPCSSNNYSPVFLATLPPSLTALYDARRALTSRCAVIEHFCACRRFTRLRRPTAWCGRYAASSRGDDAFHAFSADVNDVLRTFRALLTAFSTRCCWRTLITTRRCRASFDAYASVRRAGRHR